MITRPYSLCSHTVSVHTTSPLQFKLTTLILTGLCYISSHHFYTPIKQSCCCFVCFFGGRGVYRSHCVDSRSVRHHFLSGQLFLNHLMEFIEIYVFSNLTSSKFAGLAILNNVIRNIRISSFPFFKFFFASRIINVSFISFQSSF